MIEKCPSCKEKVEILPDVQIQNTTTTAGFNSTVTLIGSNISEYPDTRKTFKCSNPKCWVTKIHLSWE